MKHGDKAKASSAKAITKASAKKSEQAGKGRKAVVEAKSSQVKQASNEKGVPKTVSKALAKAAPKTAAKAPAGKAPAGKAGGNGKTRGDETDGFNNPTVAAAFKRAVK